METTVVYWGYIGRMKKKMETTMLLVVRVQCLGLGGLGVLG